MKKTCCKNNFAIFTLHNLYTIGVHEKDIYII